jgi:hypothetical protein
MHSGSDSARQKVKVPPVPNTVLYRIRTSFHYFAHRYMETVLKHCPMQCGGSGMFIPDPGSDFFPSRIPDPNCLHPGSRILIKEFKYFNPKKSKKWFLSSKKYDLGCSSRIPDPDADFLPSRIPDPGIKKAPNPGSRIRNTAPMAQ